jgi:ketosteroid isomerase-like protein
MPDINAERINAERVAAAWDALGSGDQSLVLQFWDKNVRFEVPGLHAYSGRYEGIEAYQGFYGNLYRLSGGTVRGERKVILVNAEAGYTVDVNRITATRAGADVESTSGWDHFDVDALHLLRWENGRIVEGHWMVFGDGAELTPLWWSPLDEHGDRREIR